MNDDTVRRQSRRETEPAARELAPPARKLVFYKRNTAAKFFLFYPYRNYLSAILFREEQAPPLQPPDILLRYLSAFPWGEGDHDP